jgi:hypothetical protein
VIIDREDRAVFSRQLSNRRRGRPRAAVPTISTTVRLPQPLFDAYCREAIASGRSLPEVVREALAREFPSSTNPASGRAW